VQNSLERIFEGMSSSLREHVLPEVGDPYARAQVAAAIELLGNLATRVEWRADLLHEEVERIRAVLDAAPTRAPVPDEPIPQSSDGLLETRDRHLAALAELEQGPDAAAVDDELRAFLAWQLDRELAMLRTGMYK
jgi:hypothetical protein